VKYLHIFEMDTLQKVRDNKEISAILINGESLMGFNNDCTGILDLALDNVLHQKLPAGQRGTSLELLARHCSKYQYPRLLSMMDRLPNLLESAASFDSERQPMLMLVESLLLDYTQDVSTQLSKILARYITVTCRIASKCDTNLSEAEYALHLLRILGQSKARALLLPHAKVVRQMCSTVLASTKIAHGQQNIIYNLLGEVFALYVSMESGEVWAATWVEVVQDLGTIYECLNVASSKRAGQKKQQMQQQKAKENTAKYFVVGPNNLSELRGFKKAVSVKNVFHGLCSILSQVGFLV
jgi:hypothetical protein